MRKLFLTIAAMLAFSGAVHALEFKPVGESDAQIAGSVTFDNAALVASALTLGARIEAVRFVCDVDCFVALSGTNATDATTLTDLTNYITGSFLPADTERIMHSRGNEYVVVIGVNGSGTVYIQELTR